MRTAITIVLAGLAGCGFGHVNQGQVVEYDRAHGIITLIADSNYRDPAHPRFDILPPVTIHVPADPQFMGAEPEAGKLLDFDTANRRVVVFDAATRSLRTIPYTPAGGPEDRSKETIAVYWARQRKVMRFSVPEEFRNLPDGTWKAGDEIRYYYKDPERALRLMNVSKTDLGKVGK